MNKINCSLLLFTCFCVTNISNAGSANQARITAIASNVAGTARIRFDNTEDMASCGEGFSGFSVNVNTDGGKSLYSLALSAQAQGKLVNAAGQGVCLERSDTESLQFLTLPD